MKTFIFDCETTGLDPTKDNVVEVGWVELIQEEGDWTLGESFGSLVKSPTPMSAAASGINGIRGEQLVNSPAISEIPFPTDQIRFVSHNAEFDLKFLSQHLDVRDDLCTLILARRLIPNMENYKLGTLVAACELSIGLAHRAELDAINAGELLIYMLMGTGWSLEKLSAYGKKAVLHKVMPWGKHKGMPLKDVPLPYLSWLDKQELDQDTRATVDYYLRKG
jgi:exodeoxyribonuclease X